MEAGISTAEWEKHGTDSPDLRHFLGMASSSPARRGYIEPRTVPAPPASSTPHSQPPPWDDPPFNAYNITIDGNLTVFDDGSGNNQYGIVTARQFVGGGLLFPNLVILTPSGDTTGATDTAAVNAALAAGQSVLLLPGVYFQNAPWIIPGSAQALTGAGYHATSVSAAAGFVGAAQLIVGSTGVVQNVTVGDFQLFGNATSGHCIQWRAKTSTLRNMILQNSQLDLLRMDPFAAFGGSANDCAIFNIQGIHPGFGYNSATPAVPLSTVTVTNTASIAAWVVVIGGTGTNVTINGVPQGTFDGTYSVPAGQTISLTYTAAPTWSWSLQGNGLWMDKVNDSDFYSVTFDGGLQSDSQVGGGVGFLLTNGSNNRYFGCHAFLMALGGTLVSGNMQSFYGGEMESNGTADFIYNNAHHCIMHGVGFYDHANPSPPAQHILFTGTASTKIDIGQCDYRVDSFTVPAFYTNSSSSTGISIHDCPGFNPVGVLTPPTYTAGSALLNPFPYPVRVFLAGTTAVSIGGNPTGLATGTFPLRPGETITPSGAGGSWTWFGE